MVTPYLGKMGKAIFSPLSLLLLLSLVSSVSYASYTGEGSFILYSYSVDTGEKTVSGFLREEVVSDYGNGTIRLRLEVTFNDGVATLELKTPASAFTVPRIGRIPEGQLTYSNSNFSFSISTSRVETSQVSVGGRSYLVHVFSVSGLATYRGPGHSGDNAQPLQTQFSGRLAIINGSGVIYSVEGQVTIDDRETMKFRATLLDTNIDLQAIPASSNTLPLPSQVTEIASIVGGLSGGNLGQQPRESLRVGQGAPSGAGGDEYSIRAVTVLVLGLAALASVAVIPLRRVKSPAPEASERKPHYV